MLSSAAGSGGRPFADVTLGQLGLMTDAVLRLRLPCTDEAPQLARAALAELSWIDPIRDDALLVASELVTNAVRHSGAAADDHLTFRVQAEGGSLTIAVHDVGRSRSSPHLRSGAAVGEGGLGLSIVQQLARRWDSRADTGRITWAQLDLPAEA